MRAMLRAFLIGLCCLPLAVKAGDGHYSSSVDFFATGSTTGCPSLSVTFVPDYWDDGGDPYTGWEWHFGDGQTSTDFSPTHVYSTEGMFTVQLVMVKVSGLKDTATKINYIQTASSFQVDLGLDTTICSGSSIILDATTPGATYLWNDGSTTAQLETFFEGEYIVEVTKAGCTDRDTIYVTVGSLLAADFNWTSSASCSPIAAEFSDMSQSCTGALTEWSWDFGDGNSSSEKNPTHYYAVPGEYTVLLTVKNSNGSFTSQSKTITIEGELSPSVELGSDFSLCQDSTAFLDAGNPGSSYIWNTGATTQGITATGGNKYIVTVSKDGCSVTDSVSIANIPTLGAAFDAQKLSSCLPVKYAFSDLSAHCGGDIIMWYWEFGDGGYSYEQNPEHEFATAGDFDVKLTVFHEWGEIDDTTVTLHIAPLHLAVQLGGDTTICEGETLTLNAGNPGVSYLWNTGETSQQITAGFEGQYWVKINFEGCEAADTLNLQLKSAANVAWEFSTGTACLPVPVTFNDQSTLDCSQSVSSWYWEFGDGNTSTEQNPVHHYQTEGAFIVRLTVTASGGGSASVTRSVNITNTIHTVDIPHQALICRGQTIQLDAGIDDAQYSWWPAAGLTNSTVKNPVATPPAGGYYYVDVTKCMVTSRDSILIILDSIGKPVITQDGNVLKTGNAYAYQWYREGVALPGATSKTLKVDRRGYFSVKTYNSAGCEKESNSFFFLPVSGAEKGGEARVKCSPNPVTNGIINIVLSKIPDKPAKLTVYDLRGTRVLSARLSNNINPLNATKLPRGFYMVEVVLDNQRTMLPVVIQ